MKNKLDTHITAYKGQIVYDFDNDILLNWYPHRIIKLAKNKKSILELGLGHGFATKIFSKHFSNHVVLEGSSAIIKNFRRNFSQCHAQIIKTYFEKFKSNKKFEIIVMGFVLEHVDNPLEMLIYFKKFLAPNGKMFVVVPNAEVLNRRLGNISGILPNIHKLSNNDIILGHKRYYTIKSLTRLIKDAGYEIRRVEGIYLKPFTTKQIMSLSLDKKIINALCKVGIDYPELCCGILVELKEIV